MQALATDLRREFQAASVAAGCATPTFSVFVRLLVGPSGYVYAARSLNAEAVEKRPPLPATAASSLPELPAACEAAIATAGRRLPRLQPGRQNNKPVTVELMVKLLDGNK
ncbi:MAG: hypothetical protein ACRYFK_01955 [Janthinobacterium lividum]